MAVAASYHSPIAKAPVAAMIMSEFMSNRRSLSERQAAKATGAPAMQADITSMGT